MAWCNVVKNSNNVVKKDIVIIDDFTTLYKNVKICKITKPFNRGGKPNDYGGNVIKNNDILLELYKKRNCWVSCYTNREPFYIFTGDNMSLRYEFYVKNIIGNEYTFSQSHLHYNGNMLTPFDTRNVLVVLY